MVYLCVHAEKIEVIREELSYFPTTKSPNLYAPFFLLKWKCLCSYQKKKKIFIWIRNCNSLRVIFQVSTIPFTCSGALSINLSLSRSLTLSLSLSLPPVVINRSLIQFPELINGNKWSKTKYITTTKLSISHDPISPHGKSYQTVWFPCRTQFLKLFFHTCISTSSF